MRELLTILRAVFDLALTKGVDAARTLALMRRPNFNATRGEVYLRALWRLTLAFLLVPIPLVIFGFIGGAFGKVAAPIAAILWSMATIALAIVASPLGIVVDFLKGGVTGLGERYVRFVGNILFIEYSIAFLVSTIPLRNNPGGVPLLLVTLTLLVLAGVFTKRWVVKMAIAALPLLLLSFYSPPIFRAVNALMASLEDRTATTIERIGEGTKAYNPRLRREKQMIEEAPKPPDKSLLSPGDRVMLAEKDGVMKWVVMDKDGNISDAPQSSLSELRLLPGVHTKSNPLRVDLPKGGSESKAVVLPSDSRVEFNGPTVRTVLYRKGGRWARLTATEFQQILDGTHPTIKGVPIELKFKSHPGMGGVVTVW